MAGLYDLGTGGGGGLYGGSSGGGGGLYDTSTPAVPATPAPSKKPSGGLFGLGFGPDVNLGLGDIAKMPGQIVGGLGHLAAGTVSDVATGNFSGLASRWSMAGHGMGSGLLSTVEDVPGTQLFFRHTGVGQDISNVVTGGSDALKPRPLWERIQRGQGLLSGVVSDVGQVALAASGVGAAASGAMKVGTALGLGAEDVGEAAAGGAIATEAAQAAEPAAAFPRLQAVQETAEKFAHPYRYVGREFISPFTRAAAEATGAPGAVAEQLQRAGRVEPTPPEFGPPDLRPELGPQPTEPTNGLMPGEAGPPDLRPQYGPVPPNVAEMMKGRYQIGEATVPPGPDALSPEAGLQPGPVMQKALERNTAPISDTARAVVSSLPDVVQRGLAGIEHIVQNRELRSVAREQTLAADAALKSVMASQPVQDLYSTARNQIMTDPVTGLARTLADGSPLTADIADRMLGDAIRQRGTGIEDVLNTLRDAHALPTPEWLAKQGITGPYALPREWMNQALDGAINQGVTLVQNLGQQQLQILRQGRLGDIGLENVGREQPLMTAGEKAALRNAQRELQKAASGAIRNTAERVRLEATGAKLLDREQRVLQAEDAARAAGEARTEFGDKAAPLFRSPQWGATLRDFTHRLQAPGDGATLNPGEGRILSPAAFNDGVGDTGSAVGIREIRVPGMEASITPGRVPLAEWNRVTDVATGTTRGDEITAQVARDYQKALANRDLNLGLWVDPNGEVSLDISQTSQGGNPLTRQQARTLGAFRGQDAIFDMRTGDEVSTNQVNPGVASYFLDQHAGRDATSATYQKLLDREQTLAKAEGRNPRITQDQVDAIMDAQDMMAIHLSQVRPDDFKTADAAYKAVKQTLGVDPKRLPMNALLDATLPATGIGRQWWDAAKARFPHWEQMAAWYGRSHDGIEGAFRGRTMTMLDGSQRDMADVAYDMLALSSVQATPFENLANAMRAIKNTQLTTKALSERLIDVQDLLNEFEQYGVQGPRFSQIAGNYTDEAVRQLKEENPSLIAGAADKTRRAQELAPDLPIKKLADAPKEIQAQVNAEAKAHVALIDQRKLQLAASAPTATEKMHMYGDPTRTMLPILMGKPLDTFTADDLTKYFPDIVGIKAKDKLAMGPALNAAREIAENRGMTIEEYTHERGLARLNALQQGGSSEAAHLTEADIPRLGEQQILKEHYSGQAMAKMRSFRENLASPNASDAVTLDQWMDRLFSRQGKTDADPVKDPGGANIGEGKYAIWAEEIRKTAQDLRDEGVTVDGMPIRGHHVQGLLWGYAMDEWNRLMGKPHFDLKGALPEAQDFLHILEDPADKHLNLLHDIAHNEGFNSFGDMVLSEFQSSLAQHPFFKDVKFDQDPFGKIRGATWAQDATHIITRYFETADPVTLIHENSHAFRMLLPQSELDGLERAYGVTGHNWTTRADEAFAEDWSRMLAGRAAHADAVPAIRRLQNLLSSAWQIFRDRGIGGRVIPQDTAELFDRVFNVNAPQAGTVKEAKLQARLAREEAANIKSGGLAAAKLDRAAEMRANLGAAQATLKSRFEALDQKDAAVLSTQDRARQAAQRVMDAQDNPALTRTPAQFQPIWHAYSSLVGHAVETGDPELAKTLIEMGDGLPDLIEHAKATGFDPSYIPKMTDAQVRRVVFQGMRLVRPAEAADERAGARYGRSYAKPEGMDRSIAGLAGGMIDAIHEQHANAVVQYVEDAFVRRVPEDGVIPKGWTNWNATRQYILIGEEGSTLRVGGPGLMVPDNVAKTLRSYGQNFDHPAFQAMRGVTKPWRMLTLAMSPSWYAHVLVGHGMMSWAAGASPWKLGVWADAWRAWREGKVEGQLLSNFTPDTQAATRGALHGYQVGQDEAQTGMVPTFREAVGQAGGVRHPLATAGVAAGRLSRVVQMTDEVGRVATFLAERSKQLGSGATSEAADLAALDKVHSLLVDYGNMSPFEQQVIRNVVPFYAFQKGILKVAFKYQLDNPAIMGIMANFALINKQMGLDQRPEAYQMVANLPLVGQTNLAPFTSFADSEKLLTPQGIGAAINPFVRFGAEQLFGAPSASGKVNELRITPTGGTQEVPRLSNLLTNFTNTGGAQLANRVASGNLAATLGLGTYSDQQVLQAMAKYLQSQGQLQGLTAGQNAAAIAAAGLPAILTAAQKARLASTGSATATPNTGLTGLYAQPATSQRGTATSGTHRPSVRSAHAARKTSAHARTPGIKALRPRRPRRTR